MIDVATNGLFEVVLSRSGFTATPHAIFGCPSLSDIDVDCGRQRLIRIRLLPSHRDKISEHLITFESQAAAHCYARQLAAPLAPHFAAKRTVWTSAGKEVAREFWSRNTPQQSLNKALRRWLYDFVGLSSTCLTFLLKGYFSPGRICLLLRNCVDAE